MSWRAAAAAALVTAAVCFLIARGNSYQTFIIVTVGLTAIVGIGLNVLLGLSGQISLGHVAFYAIGAYAVGILTTAHDWPFWPALAVGGLVAGLAGVLLAIPALRVRGPYLAMVTIAFGFVVEQGAAEWQDLTGGWNGLSGIPGPAVFGAEIGEKGIGFLTVALTVLSIAAFSRLSDSPWGNAMRAVQGFGIRQYLDRPRSDADPHDGVRHLGSARRDCRRRLRLDQQFHQPGIVSLLPIDPVPAGRHARRRRSPARSVDRSLRRRAAAGAAWRHSANIACCLSAP